MTWLIPCVLAATFMPQPPTDAAKELVKVSLLPRDTMVKPGDTLYLGVQFEIKKDWHIYWPGQNDSGTPTVIRLTLPKESGLVAGTVTYPNPRRYTPPGGLLDYALEGRAIATIPVTIPATAKPGTTFTINAEVEFLVCNESCIPGEASLATTVKVAEKTEGRPSAQLAIDTARAAQPKPQADGFDLAATTSWSPSKAANTPDILTITSKEATTTRMTFFPADGAAKLLNPLKEGESSGKTLALSFEAGSKPIQGVLEMASGNTRKSWTLNLPRPANTSKPTSVPPPTATPAASSSPESAK